MTEPTDHFAWAEAVTDQLDRSIRMDKASSFELVGQGIVHALLAVADQLDGIRELMERGYGEEVIDIRMREPNVKPFPGP